MAEGTSRSSHGDLDDIEEKIRLLEREKNELHRRKEREERERRSSYHRADASSPRDAGATPVRGKDDDNSRDQHQRSAENYSAQLSSGLEESQARLKSLFSSVSGGASSYQNDPQEDSYRSSDDGDGDDVMSHKHKQILRTNRDVLVENMTPDDIFNDLISKHIFSNADVSRIKERNTVEAINEELLNHLVRRSDRAFYVFVASLRRTLQGWLANRLDPAVPGRNKRKRRTGEMNVNVDCQEVTPSNKKKYVCSCHEVEEQILQMAKGAFANIRRRDTTPSAHEQFRKELQQTNEIIKDSLEIMNTLKLLCKHGELTNLSTGSIRFTIRCKSLLACHSLWKKYKSGLLRKAIQEGCVSKSLLKACGAKRISLRVSIAESEYLQCAVELKCERDDMSKENQLRATPIKRRLRQKSKRTSSRMVHSLCKNVCQSSDQICSTKGRQAFAEIPTNTLNPFAFRGSPTLSSTLSHPKSINPSVCINSTDCHLGITKENDVNFSRPCDELNASDERVNCGLCKGFSSNTQRIERSHGSSERLLRTKAPSFIQRKCASQKRYAAKRRQCVDGNSQFVEELPQCRYNLRFNRVLQYC